MARLSNRDPSTKKGPPVCLDSLKSSPDVDLAFFVFPPWDLLRGRDVFRDAELFEYENHEC